MIVPVAPVASASAAEESRARYPVRVTSELGDRYRLAAALMGERANTLYIRAFSEFLDEQPWQRDTDFAWLVPGVAAPSEGPRAFEQIGLFLPQSLLARADAVEGRSRRVTRAMVFFTAAQRYADRQKFPEARRVLELVSAAGAKAVS